MLVKDETVGCLHSNLKGRVLSTPHSSAFFDLDGDCMADLFLTVTDGSKSYYQIFV